jgi:hypothetical protein
MKAKPKRAATVEPVNNFEEFRKVYLPKDARSALSLSEAQFGQSLADKSIELMKEMLLVANRKGHANSADAP